jgi:hypothetical protein
MMKLDTLKLAKEMEGTNTIKSIQAMLGISRARAIYLMYRLRKSGFVLTKKDAEGDRIYYISPRYPLGGTNYIDILNEYSPIKLASSEVYQIYGRIPSIEETLVYAVKQNSVRYIIASLALFRKVSDWSSLYRIAKNEGILREICALYDVARLHVKKVKRMPKRFKNLSLPKKSEKFRRIVPFISSDDFKEIEKRWKVYIPLNTGDMEEYR